jgi:hypothetical protein
MLVQTPAEQDCPVWHLRLHPPQLFTSDVMLVSQPVPIRLSQFANPALQVNWQALATHDADAFAAPHMRPHAPQLLASVAVDTHTPPQFVCPAGQKLGSGRQIRALQDRPGPQVLPQNPQLLLLSSDTHEPLQRP